MSKLNLIDLDFLDFGALISVNICEWIDLESISKILSSFSVGGNVGPSFTIPVVGVG